MKNILSILLLFFSLASVGQDDLGSRIPVRMIYHEVQTLTGITPTLDADYGVDAIISLTGITTLTITNLIEGVEGSIEVTNGATPYTLNINGSTGYTTEVIKGTKAAINSIASTRTTVVYWRTGTILFYGFLYDN